MSEVQPSELARQFLELTTSESFIPSDDAELPPDMETARVGRKLE